MRLETTGKRYGRNDEASGGLLVGAGGGPDGTRTRDLRRDRPAF